MTKRIYTPQETHRRKIIYFCMHILVLLLSLFLIVSISIDTFHNVDFYKEPKFMEIQYWICILFLLDFFVEWALAERKWRYLLTHFVFFLVSIPYGALINYFDLSLSPQIAYLIRFVPLVRGGYALAIVVDWMTENKATGLFLAYTISLVATLYFSSVIFFVFEQHVNPLVNNYDDALWWAAMDMTTVGSNIIAVTPIGKILSVVLAALGMMLFPIFTVYITNLIQRINRRGWVMGQGNFEPESTLSRKTDTPSSGDVSDGSSATSATSNATSTSSGSSSKD
ncbi:MAG: two pore domain potassium channel family protein [Bacteroides sp.]|nr:two pore domain potassium channel family protein [Bacteroides sp.]